MNKNMEIQTALDKVHQVFSDATAITLFEAQEIADSQLKLYESERRLIELISEHQAEVPHRFRAVNLLVPDLCAEERKFITLSGAFCEGSSFLNVLNQNFNSQICWQLVNAYELFEVFLKDMYAVLGHFDNNLWPCADYGSLRINELGGQDLQWFRTAAKKLMDKGSDQVLKRMHDILPRLSEIERNNPMNCNLSFLLALIGNLRHVIVHKRGKVNLQEFTEATLKKVGLAMAAESSRPAIENIELHFVQQPSGEYYNVEIVDLFSHTGGGNANLLRKLNHLVDILASYSAVIYELATIHFGIEPIWKRQKSNSE